MSSNRVLQQPISKLRFKNLSKKSANFYNNCEYNETLDRSFLGGIQACSKGLITLRHINTFVLLLRRALGKGRFNWTKIHVCFNFRFHKTQKSSGHRMGHGKGKRTVWSHLIFPGEIFLKVLRHSKKFVFLDSFSWTIIFGYFDHYLEIYWLGISNFKRQKRKEIYNYTFILTRFSRFIRPIFRLYSNLRFLLNTRRSLSSHSISSSLLYYSAILNKLLLTLKYKILISKSNSNHLLIMMLHLILNFSIRVFIDTNTAQFSFSNSMKNHRNYFQLFNFHVLKFWLFGLLQSFLYSSKIVNNFNFTFFYYHMHKIFKLLKKFKSGQNYVRQGISSSNYNCTFLHYVKSSYNRRRALFYPKRKNIFPLSVLSTLNLIKLKTPFKSRVLFFDSNRTIFLKVCNRLLLHSSFNPMKKKKRK